jgi:hypothetical protein
MYQLGLNIPCIKLDGPVELLLQIFSFVLLFGLIYSIGNTTKNSHSSS